MYYDKLTRVGDVGKGEEMKGGRTPLWYTSKKG